MDGNRRWAKANGLNSHKGHDKGADTFVDTCEWCIRAKIKFLTVYAFSTENWSRTKLEVAHLMGLLEKFFAARIDQCIKEGIRIKIIGDRSRFDKKTLAIIERVESQTEKCSVLNVQIALSYGGRDEIVRAAKALANDVSHNKVKINDIDENLFSMYLDTAGIPDVDLVIRTGGAENMRLSNFLPWQTVYSELYFSECLWPDFSQEEFNGAVNYYDSIIKKHGK
jgi:undecaprenyl diphosphate synthase